MQVVPKAGPAIPLVDRPAAQSTQAKDSRARAIAAFNQAASANQTNNAPQQGTSVQNASNVSPEEMVGIRQEMGSTQESLQNDTSEAATSPPPAKVEEPLSPHYALLARKEKALRAEVQKFNASKAAFKAEQEASRNSGAQAPQAPTFDESKYISKDRMTQDPLAVFEELGLSGEDLANRILNGNRVDPATASYLAKLEAKLAKLEAAQDDSKKSFESAQTDSYNQAVTAMRYEAEDLINSDPEFATIKETGQSEEVINLIKDVHAKGLPGKYKQGTLLSVEQAARLVEDELVNQWVEQHEKLSRLEKIQKRLKPQTPAKPGIAPQGKQAQNQPATQNTTKTLTNNMGSSGKLSARERAIAVFNGQLKTG